MVDLDDLIENLGKDVAAFYLKNPSYFGSIETQGRSISDGGFIATVDDPKIVEEYPSRLFSLAPTSHGEWVLGDVLWERTSFANRDRAKEVVMDINATGRSVKELNAYLLGQGIFGGKDISSEFPELGQASLYCVTEMVSSEDIETLVEVVRGFLG